MKNLIEYIILGIIQGFSEPLPISSSGHLVLFQEMFGLNSNNLTLEIFLNFASLIAIIYFYRKDILSLICNNFKFVFKQEKEFKKDFDYVILVIIASIPTGILGFILKDYIGNIKNSLVVGIALLVTATALLLVNKLGSNSKLASSSNFDSSSNEEVITKKDSIIIGLAQAVALIPGISRSGSTLVGGLSRKISSDSVLKFSFLMYIPVSFATMGLEIVDTDFSNLDVIGYSISFITAIIATYLSLILLYKVVKNSNLHYFSYYCFTVGTIAILFNIFR